MFELSLYTLVRQWVNFWERFVSSMKNDMVCFSIIKYIILVYMARKIKSNESSIEKESKL